MTLVIHRRRIGERTNQVDLKHPDAQATVGALAGRQWLRSPHAAVYGMNFLRGEQISGEYATGSLLDADGWFCARDRGFVDSDGYLFIEGRADDTIIRGGENIVPAEIEEVLLAHPAVAEACVVGLPDEEWGQRIVAVVVLRGGESVDADTLRGAVRAQLRGRRPPIRSCSKTNYPIRKRASCCAGSS